MSKSTKVIVGVVAASVVVAVAAFVWWSLGDEPEAVEPVDGGEDTAPAAKPTQDVGTTSSTGPDASAATSNTAVTDDPPHQPTAVPTRSRPW